MNRQIWIAIGFALTVAALMMVKVFVYDDCYAFDTNDDANHTFVNGFAARAAMRAGELPNINLYNNFGTPLLGDALTFPFAIQSITYWIFPNHIAMTVNRATIAFLTCLVFVLFFSQFLSLRSALLCTGLVFFAPGPFWNFAHHHYQMALLCYGSILLILTASDRLRSFYLLLLTWFVYVVFILSVSIQPVVFAVPFLLLFPLLRHGRAGLRLTLTNFVAFLSAVIATLPTSIAFFRNMADSTRNGWSPYTGILASTRQQLLSLLFPAQEWMHYGINGHLRIATYISVVLLALLILGTLLLFRDWKLNRSRLSLVIILGVLPMVLGYVLNFYGTSLPGIKSIDSTRAWWFSNVFSFLAIGFLLDADWRGLSRRTGIALGIFAALFIGFIFSLRTQFPELTTVSPLHPTAAVFLCLGLVAFALSPLLQKARFLPAFGKNFFVVSIVLIQVPTLVTVLGLDIQSCGRGNHFFSRIEEATFQPSKILAAMEPGSRVASAEPAGAGHDLKAIFGGVLGSNARAIVSSRKLMDIFLENHLVTADDNYFFSPPWQFDKLNHLGIRYILEEKKSLELEAHGWSLLAEEPFLERRYFLYENPARPTLAILNDGASKQFIKSFRIKPNSIDVTLPAITSAARLDVSFFHRDSWSAWVDDREVTPQTTSLGMLEIPVQPADKMVVLRFMPSRGLDFLWSFAVAIAGLVIFCTSQFSKEGVN